MATTNAKKKKLSWSNVLLVVMRILPIILEGLNRDSEGNLEIASVQFQYNPFSGKLDAFVDSGLDKDTVHRTVTQTKALVSPKAAEVLLNKWPIALSNEGIDIVVDIRK